MASIAIISMYDGPEEYRILSNLAHTPFELDGTIYQTVEGFWQSLKTDDPIQKMKIASYTDGRDALQAGRRLPPSPQIFTYMERVYKVGSQEHWTILERAIRAKTAAHPDVQRSLRISGNRVFKHLLLNRFKTWRSGDSPALPAYIFERIWTTIRGELLTDTFKPSIVLPPSVWIHTSTPEN